MMMAAHQIIGHGRHERARQDERADQRKDHRLGHRPEQIAGDAAELEHRYEHDAEAQQCHECRNDDLLRAVEDRRFDRFALFEMVVDVFDRHGAVVDQNADGERKPAERHDVDGLAEPGQQRQRKQDGQRNFDEDDDGRAPAAEKQQDHHADQGCRQRGLADDPEHGRLDEDRLIADGAQIEARRQAFFDPRQQRFDALNDAERRGRAGFEDGHQHRARSVDAHEVGLRRRALMHVGDVAHVDDGAVDLLDRQIVDLLEHRRTGIERDVPVEFADLLVAGRQDQVLHRDGVDDVVGRDVVGLHGLLVEIDLHLQDFAAVGRGHRRAGDGGKLRPDEVLPEVEQLHLRQLFARQRELQDRNARRVVAQHIGRGDAGRQELEHRLRGGRHLRQRGGDVDILLKEDFDDAVAVERLRFDVLDIADLRRQCALVVVDDAAGHVVRQQAVIGPNDADHRDVDVGKDVGRRLHGGADAEQRDDDREHDEGVGTSERGKNDPHCRISYGCRAGCRATVQHAEHGRNEEQRCDRGDGQSADQRRGRAAHSARRPRRAQKPSAPCR